MLNRNYRNRNLFAYNFAGFACVAVVVFLAATQPFYLSDVLKIDPDKVGSAIGTLGFLDEIVAITLAVFVGTLNDKINCWAWRRLVPSGTRVLQLGGFGVMSVALAGYGKFAADLFPDLWLWRGLFALGFTACMSMATVMLHETNNSDFRWMNLAFWRAREEHVTESEAPPRNGRLAALLGMSTGLGAVFSVAVLLPLPVKIGDHHPELASRDTLQRLYLYLAAGVVVCGVVVFFLAYDSVRNRGLVALEADEEPKKLYVELLREGLKVGQKDAAVQLAYASGFVARSTAVANSVFIPLMVYKFYFAHGKCSLQDYLKKSDVPQKDTCYEGYVFLAILTGVAQTVALVSAPVWGVLVDARKMGTSVSLMVAAGLGAVGSFGLCLAGWKLDAYDPRNVWCFLLVSCVGLSQIGTIIAGMSLLSAVGLSVQDHKHHVIGGISGTYTLCGGVGILVITKLGGSWADRWVFAPFFILGLINALLAVFLWVSRSRASAIGYEPVSGGA